jgi:hypothetical protein
MVSFGEEPIPDRNEDRPGAMAFSEGVALTATVVSAGAAVVGTAVTVAQWRSRPGSVELHHSRNEPTRSPIDVRHTRGEQYSAIPAPRIAQSKIRLAAGLSVLLGTVACVGIGAAFVLYQAAPEGPERPVTVLFVLGMVSGAIGCIAGLATAAIATGIARFDAARTAVIGLLLSAVPWILSLVFP